MVTWEQRVMVGDPKFEVSQDLPKFPYARYAKLVGLAAFEVDNPDRIKEALSAAVAADRPVLVECHTDPEVPPLPPHISFKQAKNFMSSIAHGDSHRWQMIENAAKQTWAKIKV
jgi:pyruvate dehydrogenase (quinone)